MGVCVGQGWNGSAVHEIFTVNCPVCLTKEPYVAIGKHNRWLSKLFMSHFSLIRQVYNFFGVNFEKYKLYNNPYAGEIQTSYVLRKNMVYNKKIQKVVIIRIFHIEIVCSQNVCTIIWPE